MTGCMVDPLQQLTRAILPRYRPNRLFRSDCNVKCPWVAAALSARGGNSGVIQKLPEKAMECQRKDR
jgi:hypothetical protein